MENQETNKQTNHVKFEVKNDSPEGIGGSTNGPPGQRPTANSASFQKILDENSTLIKTISDYRNMGRHHETISYQWQLHRNLMHLVQMTDANQNLQNLLPPPGQVPPPGMAAARPTGPPSGPPGGPPGEQSSDYGPSYSYSGSGGPRPGYGPQYTGGGPGYNGPDRGYGGPPSGPGGYNSSYGGSGPGYSGPPGSQYPPNQIYHVKDGEVSMKFEVKSDSPAKTEDETQGINDDNKI